ncbi:LOW QUALITY PROTEIN: hypothetical protein TorRG33x02_035540, partial [Trema orientale]
AANDDLEIAEPIDTSLTPSLNTQKLPQPSHSLCHSLFSSFTVTTSQGRRPETQPSNITPPHPCSNAAPSVQQHCPVRARRLSRSVSGTLSSISHSISVPRLTRTELQLLLKSLSLEELKHSSLSRTFSVALLSLFLSSSQPSATLSLSLSSLRPSATPSLSSLSPRA